MSEPGVSGGCVADPVARAKGADKARYVHRSTKGATGRSYQPSRNLAQSRFAVNRWRNGARGRKSL